MLLFQEGDLTIMVRVFKSSLAIAATLLLTLPACKAERDVTSPAEPAAEFEMVVVEAKGCIYCKLFRRDVEPTYVTSKHQKVAPLHYLDVNAERLDRMDLVAPVSIVPTAVLIKDNKEIFRIPGYTGPENFFHSVSYMLRTN